MNDSRLKDQDLNMFAELPDLMKEQPTPPGFFLRLFRWFCDPALHAFIEGDLLELYRERVGELGRRKADIRFAGDVLLLFRPGIIRSFKWAKPLVNQLHMLANYFKIFRRNFRRQPVKNWLNLSCLALGIAAAACIGLYLDFEISYDRMHQRADRIYRVNTEAIRTREKVIEVDWQTSPAKLGPLALQDYPEVDASVRFFNFFTHNVLLYHGDRVIEEDPENVIAVDGNVFEVFSFDLLQGDPQTALRGPNKVVISEGLAKRLFGQENPMGQTLTSSLTHQVSGEEREFALEVSGVYRDLPRNTHLYFQAMLSADSDPELNTYYFGRFNVYTYLLLQDQVAPENVAPKLTAIYDRYLDPTRDEVLVNVTHGLQPLKQIHFLETGGTGYLYVFGGVGLLVLLIAFIGYINLVTAQAGKRAREIGLRKVLGSGRRQLIFQFLAESFFLTLLAVGLAICFLCLMIGPINSTLGLYLSTDQLLQPKPILVFTGIILSLSLVGGSYPAFFLSSFQPLGVIKGTQARSAPLQQWLLGVQFAVVLFVLACTGVIYRQLQFLRHKDLGFLSDHIVQVYGMGREAGDKTSVLKETLQRNPAVLSVATCDFTPGVGGMINRPASAEASEPQFVRCGRIDYDYLSTMDIELVLGRNFSPDFPADSTVNVLVNETFVRRFELGDQPVGSLVKYGDWGNPQAFEIIGVVKDFHQSSLHAAIEPQLFRLGPAGGNLVIQTAPDPQPAIRLLEQTWSSLFPDRQLEYSFLEEDLLQRYEEDQRRGSLFLLFSGITIGIAFAGLYGLAAYLTGRRSREVGIRKVLGAGLAGIVLLLSRSFLFLVLVAAVPALLLASWVSRRWLENFAFQAPISVSLYVLVLSVVLVLVGLTVGWHAARTAARNPREVLQ